MSNSFESMTEEECLAHLEAVARRALPLWGLSDDSAVTLINRSENATYRVDVPNLDVPRIMRVHRTGYHTIDGVRTELDWMRALNAEAGVKTPQAIAALDGSLIQTVDTVELDESRMVVLFEHIPGAEPDESALLEPFGRLGAIAAKMHSHARSWQRPDYFERLTWDYDHSLGARANWGRWQDGLGLTADAKTLLARVDGVLRERLAAFGQSPERYGLIHADLRLANLLETGDETRVIDFDDCGLGWFLYDVATALSFMEARDDVDELIDAWLSGYRTVADLPADDIEEIPTFLMLRRLLIIAWIGSHADTDTARELGAPFAAETLPLAETYLARFS